ncbi:hypothetical protein [Chryseobacterium aurantiacum]|uniref:hypothetical protein n=1 Tax=Chryseobacterium aurantiacum TaxID=2116499 RepID=UPI000D13E4F7|nr:hypothetical protein [Chryseobacterium aurantiacum]
MKSTKLSDLSLDELTQEEKKRSAIHIFFSILIGIMVGAAIYTTIRKGFSAISPLPLAFLPLYLTIRNSLQSVRKEILSRKAN